MTSAAEIGFFSAISCVDRRKAGLPAWRRQSGFTLLEVLLALALFAIVAGASAPFLISLFAESGRDDAIGRIEEAALAAHTAAITTGERKVLHLSADGVSPEGKLPPGWRLEVRRLTDSRFRAPREGEVWEFNSAGLCEPLALRLTGDDGSVELRFDPITGQTLDE